uniref:Reverse transcriptase domain-containing protein n=1 Tax=Cyprinus carpio TaxID=7962 RepID=A0A8C2KCI6_CYPCA
VLSKDIKKLEQDYPTLINQEFMRFYKLLYTSQGTDMVKTHTFQDKLDIPSLTKVPRDCLEGDLTEVEIQEAISCLDAGKSPGLDGFSIDFFKAFIPKIIKPLNDMYMQAIESQHLPDSLEQAMITLLLKPGKDPCLCGSYRPISLLNSDYKVFAKIIALRLEKVISQLVDYPVIAVSLDAKKAFDQSEWLYLLSVLQKMNFGPKFINMVKMLYNHPTAVIQTNSEISTLFSLERGTRQGSIEPLDIAIYSHDVISGFTTLQSRHVISLYTDDIMLNLINVNSIIPALTTLPQDYGIISGYKINVNKSVSMPLNIAATRLPLKPLSHCTSDPENCWNIAGLPSV